MEGLGSRREKGVLLQPAPGDAHEAGGLGAVHRSAKRKLWGPLIPVPSLCAINLQAGESGVGELGLALGFRGHGAAALVSAPWVLDTCQLWQPKH